MVSLDQPCCTWIALGMGILLVATPSSAKQLTKFSTDEFAYKHLIEEQDDPQVARLAYQVIEDEAAESGKVLSISLNKRLIQRDDVTVLDTPAAVDLSEGLYRVTVRMKVQGMMNSLGSAILIQAGDQKRAVYLNEFDQEDTYQPFSLDFEIRPGNVLTRRLGLPRGSAPGGPGNLVPLAAIPGIEEDLKNLDRPWIDRTAHWVVAAVVGRQLELAAADRDSYVDAVKTAIAAADGRELVFEDRTQPAKLTRKIIEAINRTGESPKSTGVSLVFPKNTTGSVTATRGASTPQPTLRKLFVDWITLERLAEPDHIVVRQVQVQYPWRRPGEAQRFSVWLHNRSGATRTGTLRLLLRNGLEGEETLWTQPLKLEDGRYERIERDWLIPPDQRLWGQMVVAQILVDEQVLSSAHTWFALHPFSNAVMIPQKANDQRFRHPYATYPQLRNHRECFGAACTIYDSAGVVPDPDMFFEPYVVGNGIFFMSIPTLMSVTRGHQAEGIAPFFYLESNGTSQRAFKIFWDHPDWVHVLPANTDEFLAKRQQDIANALPLLRDGKWQTADGKQPRITRGGGAYSGQHVALNGLIKQNVDRVIEGTIKLCKHAPFAGVRWDGLPFAAYDTKALGGRFGKSAEELGKIEAENLARFRQEVRAQFPQFQLRANYGTGPLMERQKDPFDFEKARRIIDDMPHVKELLHGHGSIMEEAWMTYAGYGNYRNVCRNYLRACHFESAAVKYAGGHHGHMLWFYDDKSQYTPDEIYQQVFSLLGGAHLDAGFGPIPESIYDLGVYAVRFSEYFWDPALRPIPNLDAKVIVDTEADIWYAQTGFEKVDESGNLLYVVPLINAPVTERWLTNRFGLLPAPIHEPFLMTVQVPQGYRKPTAVYLLENDPHPHVQPLAFQDLDGEVSFEIPRLVVFKVVVVAFGK